MGPKLLYRWVNIIHPYSQPSDNPEPARPESVAILADRLWIVRGLSIWEDYVYPPMENFGGRWIQILKIVQITSHLNKIVRWSPILGGQQFFTCISRGDEKIFNGNFQRLATYMSHYHFILPKTHCIILSYILVRWHMEAKYWKKYFHCNK